MILTRGGFKERKNDNKDVPTILFLLRSLFIII